jgi:hypothetical protein
LGVASLFKKKEEKTERISKEYSAISSYNNAFKKA